MELYKVLGVDKSADPKEIKKAYYGLAKTHHPDKGGNEDEFKKIQRAFDVLSDPEKRNFYDQTGQVQDEQGGQPQGPPGGFPFDLGGMFGGMFGGGGPFGAHFGGGGGGQRPGPPSANRRGKAPPKVHEIHLPLSDFYHGRSIVINFERQKFCPECNGDGYSYGPACDGCGGAGMQTVRMMMGPGMMVQTQQPCGACGGAGKKKGPQCNKCNGKCFFNQEKGLTVNIEAGMKPKERMAFYGECSDQQEYGEPGDVFIQLDEADEDIPWKRDGATLMANLTVNLTDSLLGSKKVIDKHPGFPEGCEVLIPAGSVNQQVITIKGAGMPVRGQPGQKGNALITLHVKIEAGELAGVQKNIEMLRAIFKSAAAPVT